MNRIVIKLYKDDPHRSWSDANSNHSQYVPVIQGEAGSETLEFHLMRNPTEAFDLTGSCVTYFFTKPDGLPVFLAADVPAETAAQGIASVTLTAQSTAASGITRHSEVRVTGKDGSVLKFSAPDLYISCSDTENEIESRSEFHALDLALNKAEETLKNAENVLDCGRQAISDAATAATNATNSANAAAQAAVDAASATAAANTAAKAAADSAQAAETAAQRANMTASFCEAISSNLNDAIAAQIGTQKDAAGGLATLNAQKKLVQMPTAADVGASNPNLLLNGDFSVWQRGTSFSITDASKYVYTADRWRVKSATTITKDNSGLKTSAACTLEQRLEDDDYRKISGKTVTLSYSVNGTIISSTFTASSAVISISLAAGNVLNWAKLELGGTATTFSPRPYAEELLLCQRFYERQENILINVQSPLTAFDQTFPYRVQKRCTASVQIYSPSGTAGKVGFFGGSGWVDHDVSITPSDDSCGHNIRIGVQGSGYFQFGFTADSEIYD